MSTVAGTRSGQPHTFLNIAISTYFESIVAKIRINLGLLRSIYTHAGVTSISVALDMVR